MAKPEIIPVQNQAPQLIEEQIQAEEAPDTPESLPGVPKVDHLKVRIRDGEKQFQVELTPEKSSQNGVTHIAGRRLKGEHTYLENRYSYGPEVVALQKPTEGQEPVWEIVDGGVALYPVITYEGLKIAIFNRPHN